MNTKTKFFVLTNGEVLTNVLRVNKNVFSVKRTNTVPREFTLKQVLRILSLKSYDKLFKSTFPRIQSALCESKNMLRIVTLLWNDKFVENEEDEVDLDYLQGFLYRNAKESKNNFSVMCKILLQKLFAVSLQEEKELEIVSISLEDVKSYLEE